MKLQSVRIIEKPEGLSSLGWQSQAAYPSHNGQRIAWLSDIGEFHMGASEFALRIGRPGESVEPLQRIKIPGHVRQKIMKPEAYQPWTMDDTELLVMFWQGPAVLFNPDVGKARMIAESEDSMGPAACSDKLPLVFFFSRMYRQPTELRLASLEASDVVATRFLLPERSKAFWLADGAHILMLEQGGGVVPALRLFDAQACKIVGTVSLDPAKLYPYSTEKYKCVNRQGFALERDATQWSVGYLLDEWGQAAYMAKEQRLILSIARPDGEPFKKNQQWMCLAETKWIEAQLTF